jgi:hypothetical protein
MQKEVLAGLVLIAVLITALFAFWIITNTQKQGTSSIPLQSQLTSIKTESLL